MKHIAERNATPDRVFNMNNLWVLPEDQAFDGHRVHGLAERVEQVRTLQLILHHRGVIKKREIYKMASPFFERRTQDSPTTADTS